MNEEVEAFLALAAESAEVAQMLVGTGHYRIAVSRSYYCMFYCTKALHENEGRSLSRHGAVIAAFGREFVKTGRFDPKLHAYFREAFRERQRSDYVAMASVSEAAARTALERAGEFIEATRAYLREHGDEEGGGGA
ncbi:MAG: HEPN domain-containing protein [Planctomycetota bacterium]